VSGGNRSATAHRSTRPPGASRATSRPAADEELLARGREHAHRDLVGKPWEPVPQLAGTKVDRKQVVAADGRAEVTAEVGRRTSHGDRAGSVERGTPRNELAGRTVEDATALGPADQHEPPRGNERRQVVGIRRERRRLAVPDRDSSHAAEPSSAADPDEAAPEIEPPCSDRELRDDGGRASVVTDGRVAPVQKPASACVESRQRVAALAPDHREVAADEDLRWRGGHCEHADLRAPVNARGAPQLLPRLLGDSEHAVPIRQKQPAAGAGETEHLATGREAGLPARVPSRVAPHVREAGAGHVPASPAVSDRVGAANALLEAVGERLQHLAVPQRDQRGRVTGGAPRRTSRSTTRREHHYREHQGLDRHHPGRG
jgi:hypothetical protein